MRISESKKEKIIEQILAFLFSVSPKPVFTINIAHETARDEEFIKTLLLTLKRKRLVIEIKKNPLGKPYKRRSRWQLSDEAYNSYKSHQQNMH